MDIGTGTSIAFATGFLAKITEVNWGKIERVSVDSSNMATTSARTFLPGDLIDPGELSVDLLFDAEVSPPFNAAAETVTVTLPSTGVGGTTTWAASGFMTGFEFTSPLEDLQTAKATIKLSGAITIVP